MQPKGKLLIIGGAEDKGEETLDMENKNIRFKRYEILKTLLLSSRKKSIEVITTSSRVPAEVSDSYDRAFGKIGYGKVNFLNINSRSETKDKDYLERIREAGAIFFTGGDQSRLLRILGGTSLLDIIKKKYYTEENFLLAGTSAGAMALSDIMIKEGSVQEAILAKDLKLTKGLNFISNLIIDTHFIKRGRFGRLAHAISLNPDHLGIGLGEDTALIIRNNLAECRGSGMVVIIDGRKIYRTNAFSAEKNEPIYVANLKVHLLSKGTAFSLRHRRVVSGPDIKT